MAIRRARDSRLLDAVESLASVPFSGSAWRIVRDGREVTQCSSVGGRWDDRTFDVLYTSTKADGAAAEMYFHLSRGQPVIPSLVKYRLYELKIDVDQCVQIPSVEVLERLGLKVSTFGQLSYSDREQEYPRTQEIGEAAYFHVQKCLLVPSARSEHPNLVVICEWAGSAAVEVVKDHGLIDWGLWRKKPFGY